DEMESRLAEIAENLGSRLTRAGVVGRTLTLKIKYTDFSVTTRSTTLHQDLQHSIDITNTSCLLLRQPPPQRPVRLLGISISNLHRGARGGGGEQLRLTLTPRWIRKLGGRCPLVG